MRGFIPYFFVNPATVNFLTLLFAFSAIDVADHVKFN